MYSSGGSSKHVMWKRTWTSPKSLVLRKTDVLSQSTNGGAPENQTPKIHLIDVHSPRAGMSMAGILSIVRLGGNLWFKNSRFKHTILYGTQRRIQTVAVRQKIPLFSIIATLKSNDDPPTNPLSTKQNNNTQWLINLRKSRLLSSRRLSPCSIRMVMVSFVMEREWCWFWCFDKRVIAGGVG